MCALLPEIRKFHFLSNFVVDESEVTGTQEPTESGKQPIDPVDRTSGREMGDKFKLRDGTYFKKLFKIFTLTPV